VTNLGPLTTERDFPETKGTSSTDGVRLGRAKGSTTIDTSKCSHSSIRQLLALLTGEPSRGPPTSDYLAGIYNAPFHHVHW
jgi:hypothetical protein